MDNFSETSTGNSNSKPGSDRIGVAVAYPADKTIVDLFVGQAQRTPDNVAVTDGDTSLTYQELNDKSTQLAHYLLTRGVTPEMFVPICLNRSLNMIVGILAILKAGGVYVPIDPDYPTDRITYMLTDTAATVILADSYAVDKLPPKTGVGIICLDRDRETIGQASTEAVLPTIAPDNLAYVIYTSGSTGRPKGVLIEHRNVVRLFMTDAPLFDFTSDDVWTMFHSFCFDFSVWEMYGALFYGGRLIIVPKQVTKDAASFGELLIDQGVTVLNQTPSAFYVLQDYLTSRSTTVPLRYVIFGGEALTPAKLKRWNELYPACQLINMYGITETTVHVTYQEIGPDQIASVSSVIGKPIPTLSAYVLDTDRRLVPAGVEGELYVGGAGLARGYLNLPELTADRFIANPLGGSEPRLYRSGDLARQLPDGTLEYLGRIDEQVKIRGYRIELGEIETVLQQAPGVRHCVVVAKEDAGGDKRLVGYIVPEGAYDKTAIIRTLQAKLPDYMVPQLLMELTSIPLTGNGKVDKKLLPNPDASELLTGSYVAPTNRTETRISTVWKAVLNVKKVGINDNFFELGGNSLLAGTAVATLKQEYGYELPITKLYQFPTVGGISAFLDGRRKEPSTATRTIAPALNTADGATADIAVIGMAGRFPGADTIDELWTVLKEGRETITFFTADELDANLPASLVNDPAYVKARGIVRDVDQFDAPFFGLNPRLADAMDPQQRLFMEIAWEVLEKTGYLPQQYDGTVGVYAGCGNNTYYLNNVLRNQPVLNQVGDFQAMTVNEKDFIASRTAYQLNLKGPAVSVFSACSSSLLAITQAADSIRNGQCDVALAGGASVTAPVNSGHLYQEGAMLSRDGHSRSFDADAQGTVFSDGAGVVLLKSLDAARRDGDTVYAVIKGYGVNNDGGGKGSFTAPNAEGQAAAIRMAIANARIDPATISYVETHGTATPVGDPIEIEGLQMAFGDQPANQFCAIGSIKSNMGHLTAAAGVAGFIKTTLALYHRQLPASLGFATPNPVIDFANSPFFVNNTLTDWPATSAHYNGPRRAGVSSFGVGGTNVHVVLEEAADVLPTPVATPTDASAQRSAQLITWSAKSANSLDAYATRLTNFLNRSKSVNLADVAFTLQTTRPDFAHRRFVVASSVAELTEALQTTEPATYTATTTDRPAEVVFLFPGQGAQYLNMGRDLYENEPIYRQAIDECADLLLAHLDTDIRQIMYPDVLNSGAKERLKNTRYTQPALFVTEYALARLWINWGIEPTVFCGHSIGEFVGAHLAGIFTLADALKLIATRGRLVSELPRGSMLSVRMAAANVLPLLPDTLSLAAINSPKLCVVAGPDEDVAAFAHLLDEQDIPNRVLETSHGFHSAMMDPIVADFETVVRGVTLNRPRKPIVSTVSGTWLTDSQATDPHYWATHLRLTVRFADAVATLFAQSDSLLLEVGPGTVTSTLARQHAGARQATVLASLDVSTGSQSEQQAMLKTLGQLWLAGLTPDWPAFYGNQKKGKLELPTYAFDKKRCWVDPVNQIPNEAALVAAPESPGNSMPEIYSHSPVIMRKDLLLDTLKTILEDASGVETEGVTPDMSFLEIGLDSLSLTQLAIIVKREFGLPISFRQLNEEYATLDKLVAYLDATLPADAYQPQQPVAQPIAAVVAPVHVAAPVYQTQSVVSDTQPIMVAQSVGDSALGLIAQQLQILAKQVALMQGGMPVGSAPVAAPPITAAPVASAPKPVSAVSKPAISVSADLTPEEAIEIKKPFGATARIERHATELTTTQRSFLEQLTERYNRKTAASKAYSQQHRAYMADPRVVSGFKPLTKELVYPIVVNKSKGSRLWDLDGNEYIDVLNGFGSTMLGYQPDAIKNALHDQIENGFEVGPQHELAGEVSKMICEFTGFDRAALCSTGSEAVLGAMRIARATTGRSLIVAFTGSYHGIMDEVLVRGTKKLKSYPAASGIMPESVQNMLILDYGTDESLRIIKERAHELAAVLVEPVQSRRPEFRPVEFLKQVRTITEEAGTVLIFDEVITGFRMHPGGAQALFGIKADVASYGKVVGGGIPIGVIAGKKEFMDALDGGFWQYGDASFPEVGVTYFAGTFVRHPLALAAAKASLQYMKDQGPALQKSLTAKAELLADTLNAEFERLQLPFFVAQFGSLWKIKFHEEIPYSELLFTLMREKGIHVWDGFPCFMTDAHTRAEVELVARLFIESVHELIDAGFFTANRSTAASPIRNEASILLNQPPAPGAKLGRDKAGNPAWFVADPGQPGKYLQLAFK